MRENPNMVIFIKGLDLGGYSGGADLFGANLACGLQKLGVPTRLCICYKFDTDAERNIVEHIADAGIAPCFLLNWNGHTNGMSYLQALSKLDAYLDGLDIDIIHSHFHTGTLLAIWLKLSRRTRRVARTAHADHEWQRGWDGLLKQAIIRTLIFAIFPLLVDLEVGVSTYAAEVLNQRFLARMLKKRTLVIPNAIPTQEGTQSDASQARFTGWVGDHPVIGSVGRLEEQKGYKYFLEALPEVLLVFPDLEIWLIGEGSLLNELKEQSQKLRISDHVVFMGKQAKVSSLLSRMDLFVSSSLYEGLPTVVLEAMDMGVPCVVTAIPGTMDIVTDKNGLLVRAKDSKGLAKVIIAALGTPSIRKNIVANATQTMERFRIDSVCREYLEAYHRL